MIAFDNKRNQHYGPEKTHIKKNMEENKENQEGRLHCGRPEQHWRRLLLTRRIQNRN